MPRFIVIALLSASLAVAACGGDKEPNREPPAGRSPAATAAVPASTAAPESTEASSRDGVGASGSAEGVLSFLFDNALSGAGSGGFPGAAAGEGDDSLKAYLLSSADLPDGYTSFGEFAFRVEDGISEYGAVDMAASMAMTGDPEAFASGEDFGVLMSLAMRFEDLQDLESAFGELGGLTEDDLRDALAQGGEGFGGMFSDIRLLDVSGLGESAMGMGITLDLAALGEAFGGEMPGDAPSAMTMRMYFFGQGQYAGGLLRIGAGADLPEDVDELALARVIQSRLPDDS
jgi:hypothetical protein